MKKHHYMFLAVVVVLAYLAGVAFPSAGRPIVSKLGLGGA